MQTRSLINAALGFAMAAAIRAPSSRALRDAGYLGRGQVHLVRCLGSRAMEWVNAQNDRSMKAFQADPHWKPFVDEALALAQNPDRLAVPSQRANEIYNTWRDAGNPRGLLRKTSVADYLSSTPHWQTVIDFDALGKQEHVNWVPKGEACLYPGDEYCIVNISDGGEDAITGREFDLKTGKFVDGGFALPHGKQNLGWERQRQPACLARLGPGNHDQIRIRVRRETLAARYSS